jgi:hypothetical protein
MIVSVSQILRGIYHQSTLISEGLPSVRSMKWNISKHDKPMILIDWSQLIDMIDYTFSHKYFVNFQISQLWISFV